MEPAAAKLIGAGIACIGMGGAGVGVGIIFGNYLAAAVRNPSAAQGQFGNLIFGFAVTEALGIFSLFMLICVSNFVGIIPYTFTISSHIIVTVALALLVFFTVLIYGLYKNGFKFFKIFVPHGVPIYILPLVMFIEILSFFLRPVSHSVRLFANMLAGHIALKVFAGFVAMLGASLGVVGWIGGVLPLALTVALTSLELLVAFLQAYVFAILTCIYLNDAIHPGH